MYSKENKHQKTISFEVTKNDYLQHLLYSASKTPSVIQKRRRHKIILPIIYLGVAVFGIFQGNLLLILSMVAMAALWFWWFPSWERKQYIQQYNKYLDQNHVDEIGKKVKLEFNSQEIIQTEKNQTFHISYEQIRGWFETKMAVYIGLQDGYTIIIPKNDAAEIEEIKSIVYNNEFKIPIQEQLDLEWEWK
ncbi:MAG TPA: YcxB family protein [Chitinophagales bacterium]|nr:YcxB family protein [Chitinophagales bacterium]